ncbi:hypothetical protein [Rhodocaloribacter sp.]
MKHPLSILLAVLIGMAVAMPAQARQNDVTQAWAMQPKMGHDSALQTALAAHVRWRQEHNDPWTWVTFEVITGPNVGTLIARSGQHTWADFDAYQTWEHGAAADRHFETTVAPHLVAIRSAITVGDEENTYWPEDPAEARFVNVIGFDIHSGMMEQFVEGVSAYHKTIVENDFPAYHYVEYNASGDTHDVYVVIPGGSMADFARPEKTVDQLMAEVHGEKAFKALQESVDAAVEGSESFMAVHRPDLSVTGTGAMAEGN